MEISVLIPTYENLNRIPAIIDKLKFSKEFEIIVSADELPQKDLEFLKARGVRLCLSKDRRGKVTALNEAVKMARGKLLVFLDADTVPKHDNFLEKVWSEFQKDPFDMAAVKLGVTKRSFLSKAIDVEYMFLNLEMSLGNFLKKPVPTIGAVIIITKDLFNRLGGFHRVIVEDVDIGLRANSLGARYRYLNNIEAETFAPSELKNWITQRKRWMSGGSELFFGDQKKSVIKNLPISLAAITSYYPMISAFLTSIVLVMLFFSKISAMIILGLTLGLTTAMGIIAYQRLKWNLTLPQFLSYLFVYGPLLSIYVFLSFFVFAIKREKLEDWVV